MAENYAASVEKAIRHGNTARAIAYEEFHFSIVMLNSFQHPSRLPDRPVQVEKWTLKRVQGDD